jgi:hypothetical protein
MNTANKTIHSTLSALLTAAVLLSNPAAGSAAQSTNADAAKIVRSADGRTSERGDAATRERATMVESEPLTVERARAGAKADSRTAAAVLDEAWVYDADVELFDDYDGDGHYTYLRVSFDVDSIYSEHYVYARLFLTRDGINWDEYHITEDFLVEGTSPFDDYEVETELVTGFPPDYYDALIELYDADFGYFLAEFGPADSSAFSLLPLEDIDNDTVEPAVVIVTEHGGGGATDLYTVSALSLFAALSVLSRRRGRQRRKTASAVV